MSRPSSYHPSLSNTSSLHSSTQSSALQTRINAKRAELDNLKQLRDLSATLAAQMSALEQKLSTLRDGTEAVAHVLANWDNVLGVIGMAGGKTFALPWNFQSDIHTNSSVYTAHAASLIPKDHENGDLQPQEPNLPETLVRIPVHSQATKEDPAEGD